jgi:serine/threonine protein kinase
LSVILYKALFGSTGIHAASIPSFGWITEIVPRNQSVLQTGANIFQGWAQVLASCHERHIVHGDIKLENVMVSADKRSTTVIDFGMASLRNGVHPLPAHGFSLLPHLRSRMKPVSMYAHLVGTMQQSSSVGLLCLKLPAEGALML